MKVGGRISCTDSTERDRGVVSNSKRRPGLGSVLLQISKRRASAIAGRPVESVVLATIGTTSEAT